MKGKETVQALRICATHIEKGCGLCPQMKYMRCTERLADEAITMIERLTAENTELREKQRWIPVTERMPEEIKDPLTEDAMINLAAQALGVEPSRLRELAEADKDGRVVVLPCKQGDELWTYGNFPHGREVYRFTVSDVSTLNGRTVLNTLGFGTIRPEDIGKTVFLSREEAEKALQEMEGKKDDKT